MSLIKRLMMTPEKLAANRSNGAQSQGPATSESLGRVREANLLHGHYSKSPHECMRALGEKPEDLPAGRARKIWLRLAQLVRPEQPDPAGRCEAEGVGIALGDEARREQARAELRSLLRQEIDDRNRAYRERCDERAREISPAFRDAYMMPSHPRLQVLLRAEDSAFNQMRHVTDMLVKLKAQRRIEAKQAAGNPQDEGESHDVIENKGSGSGSLGESHDVYEN